MAEKHGFLSEGAHDRILKAAAELCAEEGYEAVDLEALARRTGLAADAVAEIFGGREEAAEAAVEAILVAVVELVGQLYSPDRSEPESYLRAIDGILKLMAENHAFAYVSFIAARQMMPPDVGQGLENGARLLSAMLERMWDQSRSGTQPARTARAALGGAEALVRREVARGRSAELPRLLPDLVYAATVPFLGQDEALRLVRASRRFLWEDGVAA